MVSRRLERTVESRLRNLGVEAFVAWCGVRRRWSDREKVLQENLFPGYVFCRYSFADRIMVLSQPGVEGILKLDGIPAVVPDEEIARVRRLVESGSPLEPWPFSDSGQRVRIEHGALTGLEGILVEDPSAWRVVVSVETLQMSIVVELDRDQILSLSTVSS
jgi:transcription termination/antitermination protein NusG